MPHRYPHVVHLRPSRPLDRGEMEGLPGLAPALHDDMAAHATDHERVRELDSGLRALAAERDRLYARAAQRRLVSRGSSPVFDDDDFYRVLVRDAAASVGAAQPAPVLRERRGAPSTRPTQRPTTKGRTLRFDVHERLAGFMAPAGDAGCWSAERTAAFVSSIFPARA